MKKKSLAFAAAVVALAASAGAVVFVRQRPVAAHAWLVFGPASNVRVLVTALGDTITVEPYAGHAPAGRKAQFKDHGQPLAITFADPDGVTSYTIRKCGSPIVAAERTKATPAELIVGVDVDGPVRYRQYSDTPLAPDARAAAVSHFHGPLNVGPVSTWEGPANLALHRGGR